MEQFRSSPPIHGAFQGLEPVDLALGLSVAPMLAHCVLDGSEVIPYCIGKAAHAVEAGPALSRLATLTLRAEVDLPYRAIQSEIGDLINLVVHIDRRSGKRYLSEVVRIAGFNPETNQYQTETLFHI
jgi:hypothetical protein